MNPFQVIVDISTTIVEINEENENLRRKEILEKRKRKDAEKWEKEKKEQELWQKATKEEIANPDEWMVLPYGWSPFGIYL